MLPFLTFLTFLSTLQGLVRLYQFWWCLRIRSWQMAELASGFNQRIFCDQLNLTFLIFLLLDLISQHLCDLWSVVNYLLNINTSGQNICCDKNFLQSIPEPVQHLHYQNKQWSKYFVDNCVEVVCFISDVDLVWFG